MVWAAENTDNDSLDALERMFERPASGVRTRRHCNDCHWTFYAHKTTPVQCPFCLSTKVDVA